MKFFYDSKKRTLDINSKEIGNIKEYKIDMKDSGSSLRFLVPILMLFQKDFKVKGSSLLMGRPMDTYFSVFNEKEFSQEVNKEKESVYLVKGPIKGDTYILSGKKSSQFITGLLFALPLAEEDSYIIIKDELES